MMMWSGWVGALIVGLCFLVGAMSASVWQRVLQICGALPLVGYAAWRADYPMLALAVLCAAGALIAAWRQRRECRRARSVEVTLACDRFERARRAVKDSVSTESI